GRLDLLKDDIKAMLEDPSGPQYEDDLFKMVNSLLALSEHTTRQSLFRSFAEGLLPDHFKFLIDLPRHEKLPRDLFQEVGKALVNSGEYGTEQVLSFINFFGFNARDEQIEILKLAAGKSGLLVLNCLEVMEMDSEVEEIKSLAYLTMHETIVDCIKEGNGN